MIAQIPRINSVDFALGVELGLQPDWSHWHMVAFADSLAASTTAAGTQLTGESSLGVTAFTAGVAVALKIKSFDTNDTSAGTGLRTLYFAGLDASFNQLSETITMNGTTAVSTVNSYAYINEAYGLTYGSSKGNVGIIRIRNSADSVDHYRMATQEGGFKIGEYTVPAGKTLYIINSEYESQVGVASVYQSFTVRITTSGGVVTLLPLTYFHSGNAHKISAGTRLQILGVSRHASSTGPAELIMSGFLHNSVD